MLLKEVRRSLVTLIFGSLVTLIFGSLVTSNMDLVEGLETWILYNRRF